MKNRTVILLVIIAVSALLLFGLGYIYSNHYYSERDQIRARLNSLPNVEILEISGRKDFLSFNVRRATLHLTDCPDSLIELELPALGILEDSDDILLSQIGRWRLSSRGERFIETTDYASGKPIQVKQSYGLGHIEIGVAGPISSQFPFKIRNLQDIISHYKELESFFEKWPDEDFYGKRIPRYENVVSYHIPEDGR
jgi:hypothetical protein